MLNEEVIPTIAHQMNLKEIFYIHDDVFPHYAKSVRQFLDKILSNPWNG